MRICNLQDLLDPWMLFNPVIFIREITLDSRHICSGDLFIALNGYKNDGRFYIRNAINQGVVAVISESDNQEYHGYIYYIDNVPIICLYELKKHVSLIAGKFYGHPSYLLNLVGVTGTNGKTTITYLLSQWVKLLDQKSAVIGTIGYGILGDILSSINTTPSAVEVQKMLFYFYHQDVAFVAIEVSSHGLVQNRVHDLYFQAAVFTNLTHDHLDYHGNMKNYAESKWQLFSELKVKERIINADDYIGYHWLLKIPHDQGVAVTLYGELPYCWEGRWLSAISVDYYYSGFNVIFDSSWGSGSISSQLIGKCNVSNLLLALATLLALGYPLDILLNTASQLQSVCGRMEIFRSCNRPTVVVDYAHTPDALKQVLLEIRLHCLGKIWCIFGCGGDRDQIKRPIMGSIAEKYADNIVITDDNPRTEQSNKIISEIRSGLSCAESKHVQIIPQREEALIHVISQADAEDWILIAGKGHENYQILNYKQIVYSDQIIVKSLLGI